MARENMHSIHMSGREWDRRGSLVSERDFEDDKSVVPFTLGRVSVTAVVCR